MQRLDEGEYCRLLQHACCVAFGVVLAHQPSGVSRYPPRTVFLKRRPETMDQLVLSVNPSHWSSSIIVVRMDGGDVDTSGTPQRDCMCGTRQA